jgi:hypothetical protein
MNAPASITKFGPAYAAWVAATLATADAIGDEKLVLARVADRIKARAARGDASTTGMVEVAGPDGRVAVVPTWIAEALAELQRLHEQQRATSSADAAEVNYLRGQGFDVRSDADHDAAAAAFMKRQGY